jgi:hypothetical protein
VETVRQLLREQADATRRLDESHEHVGHQNTSHKPSNRCALWLASDAQHRRLYDGDGQLDSRQTMNGVAVLEGRLQRVDEDVYEAQPM